jgi:hypothetical protein
MNAVWKESVSVGRARLTLLAIADHQGELGAWPSIATLAKAVNASPRSIKRDIQYLQEIGELFVEIQNAPTTGQYKTNRYWVNLPGVTHLTPLTDSGVTNEASGVTGQVIRGDSVGTQNNINHYKKHIEKQFEEFWNAYPQKQDKAKAFKAFQKALKRAEFEDILAGVIAYRNDPRRNPDFTKFPATWLNNDSWENAAVTPEARVRFEKEREASAAFLKEQEELAKQAAPAPKCEHGNNLALCNLCVGK